MHCSALGNLNFAVNPAEITVKRFMFALVFRIQPVFFKKTAENLLQDNLQVAN